VEDVGCHQICKDGLKTLRFWFYKVQVILKASETRDKYKQLVHLRTSV